MQYQEIERYYEDKEKKFNLMEVLDIFINKDKDYIMNLPSDFLDIILNKLSFLQTPLNSNEPTNKIEIDNQTYQVNVMQKLKTGEFIAADAALKADKHDYASILAILCRKEGEIYDSKFEAEEFEKRKNMFEKQPITKIISIISFFLACYITLEKPSLLYTVVEEELNHTQQNIDSLTKIGVFKNRRMNSQMKKLRKSLKSIKCT